VAGADKQQESGLREVFLLSEKVSDLSEVGFFILGYIPDIVAGAKYQKCGLKYVM
jgi:hypothetical protein